MQQSPPIRRVTLPVGRRGRDADVVYRVAGEGDPVVLLHGIGLDAAPVSWRYALPALARNHRVYAPDFPGHGDSDKPRVRYTTAYFREALEVFLDELGLNEAALVGVSMGGSVALGHALDYPVDKLALVSSYGLGGDAGWRPPAWLLLRMPFAHRAWWRSIAASELATRAHLDGLTAGAASDELVRDVHAAVQEAAVGRTVASWQRDEFRACGLKTDYTDRLDELSSETLLVHGRGDPLLPASWSRRAAERISDGRLEQFGRCGHWPPREKPERFVSVVGEFLAA